MTLSGLRMSRGSSQPIPITYFLCSFTELTDNNIRRRGNPDFLACILETWWMEEKKQTTFETKDKNLACDI